jgi:general stress protein 26
MNNQATETLIWDHVQTIGTCMMVTSDENGVRAKPMRGIPRPEQNAIWFFADRASHMNERPRDARPRDARSPHDSDACLTFVDTRDNVFVSLSGRISHEPDTAIMHELWDDDTGTYFSDGPTDPRVILLRFEPDSGEYWVAPSSPIVIAIKFLEAKIMGERPNLGVSGRARLR